MWLTYGDLPALCYFQKCIRWFPPGKTVVQKEVRVLNFFRPGFSMSKNNQFPSRSMWTGTLYFCIAMAQYFTSSLSSWAVVNSSDFPSLQLPFPSTPLQLSFPFQSISYNTFLQCFPKHKVVGKYKAFETNVSLSQENDDAFPDSQVSDKLFHWIFEKGRVVKIKLAVKGTKCTKAVEILCQNRD